MKALFFLTCIFSFNVFSCSLAQKTQEIIGVEGRVNYYFYPPNNLSVMVKDNELVDHISFLSMDRRTQSTLASMQGKNNINDLQSFKNMYCMTVDGFCEAFEKYELQVLNVKSKENITFLVEPVFVDNVLGGYISIFGDTTQLLSDKKCISKVPTKFTEAYELFELSGQSKVVADFLEKNGVLNNSDK